MFLTSLSLATPLLALLVVGALSPLFYLATVRGDDGDDDGDASIADARERLDRLERQLRQERGFIDAGIGDVKKLKKVTRSLERIKK